MTPIDECISIAAEYIPVEDAAAAREQLRILTELAEAVLALEEISPEPFVDKCRKSDFAEAAYRDWKRQQEGGGQ